MKYPEDKCLLTVVIVFYNMRREAPRTLYTLSAAYQEGLSSHQYKVIAIDNDSPEPIDGELIKSYGDNFEYLNFKTDSMSPAAALNHGMEIADTPYVMPMIDGARMLSPGLLKRTLEAIHAFKNPFVYTLSLHLGIQLQNDAIMQGYNQQVEDALLKTVDWKSNGYLLYSISNFDTYDFSYLKQMVESNCFAISKEWLKKLGDFDTNYITSGGGMVNLEMFERYVTHPEINAVAIIGEATFHQIHGGVSTNVKRKDHPIMVYKEEYTRLTGKIFRGPEYHPFYWGTLNEITKRSPLKNRLFGTLDFVHRLRQRKELSLAKNIIDYLKKEWPHSLAVSASHARTLIELNSLDEAETEYLKVLELSPDPSANIIVDVGRLYLKKDNLEEAIRYFQKAYEKDASSFYAIRFLGLALKQKKDYRKAKEVFQQGFRLQQLNLEQKSICLLNLSHISLIQKEYKNAIDFANGAIEIDPKSITAYNHLFRNLYRSNQINRIEDNLESFYQKELSLLHLGNNFIRFKEYNLAKLAFEFGIKKEANNSHFSLGLGRAYFFLNRQEESIEFLNKSIEQNHNSIAAHQFLGNIFQQKNDLIAAEVYYLEALKYAPNSQSKADLYKRLIKCNPNKKEYYESIAKYLKLLNQHSEANDIINKMKKQFQ